MTVTDLPPSYGAVPVSAVGPTFWWGGTVTDPNPQSLFGQAFLEVQYFGADYPGTKFNYGQAAQFATAPLCGGPFGPDSTFCDTVLSPTP